MPGAGDSVVVWNPLTHERTDIVTARLDRPLGAGVRVLDADGAELPAHVEHDGRSVSWLARDVPSLGWRTYRLVPAGRRRGMAAGRRDADRQRALPAHRRPGTRRSGRVAGSRRPGADRRPDGWATSWPSTRNTRRTRPRERDPWHLLPNGPVVCCSESPAAVQAYRGPLGERLVVRGRIGDLLRYTQTLTLWRGVDRVDCRTTIDEFIGRRPAGAAALAVSGTRRHAGQRGRRRRHRARFRVAALYRCIGPRSVDTARTPVDAGQPGVRLVRVVLGGADPRRAAPPVRSRWPRWWRRRSRRRDLWRAT